MLLGHLEVCRFEPHVCTWTPIKYEAEVNMNQVALIIYQDITIMSIFYLQNIADYAVGSQALYEIKPCCHERFAGFISILFQEIFVKVDFKCFTKLISAI